MAVPNLKEKAHPLTFLRWFLATKIVAFNAVFVFAWWLIYSKLERLGCSPQWHSFVNYRCAGGSVFFNFTLWVPPSLVVIGAFDFLIFKNASKTKFYYIAASLILLVHLINLLVDVWGL